MEKLISRVSSVVVPDPTISEEAANKNHVDDLVSTSIASITLRA